MQILECPGNDLRAARAAFVNQECHGKRWTLFSRPRSRIIVLLRSNAALGRDHFCIGRQKLSTDIYRAVQKPAWIIPEIENERLHALLLQFIECFR